MGQQKFISLPTIQDGAIVYDGGYKYISNNLLGCIFYSVTL